MLGPLRGNTSAMVLVANHSPPQINAATSRATVRAMLVPQPACLLGPGVTHRGDRTRCEHRTRSQSIVLLRTCWGVRGLRRGAISYARAASCNEGDLH